MDLNLNKALKLVNYQMPTMEEILRELKNAKMFTTVDSSKGSYQLPLHYDSSLLGLCMMSQLPSKLVTINRNDITDIGDQTP